MTLVIILGVILAILLFIYINYKVIFVSKYQICNKKIPNEFDNFRILHLSDWHCTTYGKNNIKLINKINNLNADMIVITGDFIIRQKKDYKPAIEFIKQMKCNNIYFSIGNHELALSKKKLEKMTEELENIGVKVLDNTMDKIVKGKAYINIYGLTYNYAHQISRKYFDENIVEKYKRDNERLIGKVDNDEFNILLSHDPLNFKVYARMNFDLIFSGHLHGGGIRMFGFGFATPRRNWFFTRLAAGKKEIGDSTIIISRGVGNSTIPVRVFDPPEISITTLKSKI